MKKIEILDVTLRDGEQTNGVSFNSIEKLNIAKFLLEDLNVNRIEITSARVSDMELASSKKILNWAADKNLQNKIEILGFVDKGASIDWIEEAGGKNINLLTKGSLNHLTNQLRKKPTEHLKDIEFNVEYANKKNVLVNVYLEDWSNGFLNSPEYVETLISGLSQLPIQKVYLADTLGILYPTEVYKEVSKTVERFPHLNFEFHGHNDYGLSVANCLSAIEAGVKGVHVSVNGLGERSGNAPLEAVVPAIKDKLKKQTTVNENKITEISQLIEVFSGKRISENRPIVGEDVFTQTAGVHADGDKKANLYVSPITPERFGRKRTYALGKLSGKASIFQNIKELGLILTPELEKKVLQRVIELGEQKKTITIEDLPFIIADISGKNPYPIAKILFCDIHVGIGLKPKVKLEVLYKDKEYSASETGNGGYDAFMNSLRSIFRSLDISLPKLKDYSVRIPPGGKTNALVEVIITWDSKEKTNSLKTVGVDCDQVKAAIFATEKMLNIVLK